MGSSLKELVFFQKVYERVAWNRRKFGMICRRASASLARRDLRSTLFWAAVAADFASRTHLGFYASLDLELLLLEVAQQLEKRTASSTLDFSGAPAHGENGMPNVLHVMTYAFATGGHTKVVERWIRYSADTAAQSLVLTEQTNPLPATLASSVTKAAGFTLSLANGSADLLQRAALLRRIAQRWADVVVLHVHPHDTLPTVAFGNEDGPPVVLFNHADHVFWLGVSVVDLVLDMHPLGQQLTRDRRGIQETTVLPIPAAQPKAEPSDQAARNQLDISGDKVVLLTIGQHYKYVPFVSYDFLAAMQGILARHPETLLIAVGPRRDKRWLDASNRTGGRIRIPGGPQENVDLFYACANIYLDGFPFGGGTALLDAGAKGIPSVGLYKSEVPIIGSADDISLGALGVYVASIDEYVASIERLIIEPVLRDKRGKEIAERVKAEHLPPGWSNRLFSIMSSIPSSHRIRRVSIQERPVSPSDLFLAGFFAISGNHYTVANSIAKFEEHLPTRGNLDAVFELCKCGAWPSSLRVLLRFERSWLKSKITSQISRKNRV